MKLSSLDTDSYSWTEIPLYGRDGNAITTSDQRHSVSLLTIQNQSGSDRVFRINGGAPFYIKTLQTRQLDLKANGCNTGGLKVEVDTATLTSLYVDAI